MTKARDLANSADVFDTVTATELGYLDGVTSAIQTQLDSKAIPANVVNNTLVDAKGDLIAATANDTPARLAVGNNGETLVADSSASTGLRWQGNFAAGKNAIINGDFRINQRQFTSVTADGVFGFDRWFLGASDGTTTYTPQTFTIGAAPVAGYEAINFARIESTGQTLSSAYSWLRYRIEDVRTFAGQTVTVSFWAKAATGTPKIAVELAQQFGTGGSAQVTTYAGQATISTSWARYSVTVAVPSISGKTIGTGQVALTLNLMVSAGSNYDARSGSLGIQSNTFDFWGVQVEAGSVATAFQTATGTLAGELQAAQRYYYRWTAPAIGRNIGSGYIGGGATDGNLIINFPTQMRTSPTALEQSGTATDYSVLTSAGATVANAVPVFQNATEINSRIQIITAGGLTAGAGVIGRAASASAYLGWSAEL